MFTDYANERGFFLINFRRIKKYFQQISENPPVSAKIRVPFSFYFLIKTQVILKVPICRKLKAIGRGQTRIGRMSANFNLRF